MKPSVSTNKNPVKHYEAYNNSSNVLKIRQTQINSTNSTINKSKNFEKKPKSPNKKTETHATISKKDDKSFQPTLRDSSPRFKATINESFDLHESMQNQSIMTNPTVKSIKTNNQNVKKTFSYENDFQIQIFKAYKHLSANLDRSPVKHVSFKDDKQKLGQYCHKKLIKISDKLEQLDLDIQSKDHYNKLLDQVTNYEFFEKRAEDIGSSDIVLGNEGNPI